jgi:hypothetical protein
MKFILRALTACVFLLPALPACAGSRDPFMPGFSMGTQGAVLTGNGATGREPWTSASVCGDSTGFGFSLCAVSYYGATGGIGGPDGIIQAFGGGFLARRHFVVKASIARLNALDVYYEQTGFASLATDLIPFMRLSVEATGYSAGIRIPGSAAHTIAEAGLSVWVPWSWAAFSLRLEHLTIEHGDPLGRDAPRTLRCGIHAIRNRFGGQGAIVTVTPDEPFPVCFTVGEEYRIAPGVAFHAGFSNNPVFISFGVVFSLDRSDFGVALVNHERLGWSQGFAAGYHGGRIP